MSVSPSGGPNQAEDEAFAGFLLERGRLQVGAAERALRLLGRYQQRAPSARLVHVLPKHEFLTREEARHEWRRFQGSLAARRLGADPLVDEAPEEQSDLGKVAAAAEAASDPEAEFGAAGGGASTELAAAEIAESDLEVAAAEVSESAEAEGAGASESTAESSSEVAEASESAAAEVAEADPEVAAAEGIESGEACTAGVSESTAESSSAVAEGSESAEVEGAEADPEVAAAEASESSEAGGAEASADSGGEVAKASATVEPGAADGEGSDSEVAAGETSEPAEAGDGAARAEVAEGGIAEEQGSDTAGPSDAALPPQRRLVWTGDEDDLIRPSGRLKRADPGGVEVATKPPPPVFGRAKQAPDREGGLLGAPPLAGPGWGPVGEDPFGNARPRGFAIGAPAPARPRRRRREAPAHARTVFEDDPLPRVASRSSRPEPWEAPSYESPERGASGWWWVLVGISAVALVASLVYALDAIQIAGATPEARFLNEVEELPPEQVVRRAALLPEAVRGSPAVVERVAAAKDALARVGNARAEEAFAALGDVVGPAARVEVCDRALGLWEDYVPALLARATARRELQSALLAEGAALKDPWDGVREDLERALTLEPENLEALLLRAERAVRDGDSSVAERCWRKALELDPSGADGLFAFGRLAEDQGRLEAALSGYRDALEVEDVHPRTRLGVARVELRRGQPDLALAALEPLEGGDRAGEAGALGGLASWQREDRVRCERSLERALELAPGCALALGLRAFTTLPVDWRGRCVADPVQRAAAERSANAALRVDPRQPWAHLALGLLAAEPRAALRHANRALEVGGGAEAHLLRGRLRLESQDRSGGEDLRRVAGTSDALPRQRAVANLLLAEMFLGLRRGEEALQHATRAFEEHPLPEALLLRGRIYAAAQRPRRAEEDLRRATSIGPRLVDAWYERGKVLRTLDVPSRALECLDQAEGLIREGEPCTFSRSFLAYERGRIYADLDEYSTAIRHLRHFLAETKVPTSDAEGISRSRIEAERLIETCQRRLTGGR